MKKILNNFSILNKYLTYSTFCTLCYLVDSQQYTLLKDDNNYIYKPRNQLQISSLENGSEPLPVPNLAAHRNTTKQKVPLTPIHVPLWYIVCFPQKEPCQWPSVSLQCGCMCIVCQGQASVCSKMSKHPGTSYLFVSVSIKKNQKLNGNKCLDRFLNGCERKKRVLSDLHWNFELS